MSSQKEQINLNSLLEKCWSIFFDELNISYNYEPDGFENIDGVHFYIKSIATYVRIIPSLDAITELQLRQHEYFCENGSNKTLWIVGVPDDKLDMEMYLINEQNYRSLDWIKKNKADDFNTILTAFRGYLKSVAVEFFISPFNSELKLLFLPTRSNCHALSYVMALKKANEVYTAENNNMIQIKELRLGNILNISSRGLAMVISISNINTVLLHDFKNQHNYDCDLDGTTIIEPVSLTEESILMCGFRVIGLYDNVYHLGSFRIYLNKKEKAGLLKLDQEHNQLEIEISNVHQLQNIYFALTGCELVISPDVYWESLEDSED